MSLKAGSKLQFKNKYEIIKEVGDGGFGAVFEGRNVKTKKKVAIKLFKGEAFQNTAECKMYWERERDLTEATTGWPDGPHMKYIEAKEDKSDRSHPKFYLVFSFIENGQTLKSWFNDNLRAPENERMGVDDMVEHLFLPLCKYMAY